jgi:hypothetical protein
VLESAAANSPLPMLLPGPTACAVACSAAGRETKTVQGWPKLWANFRTLIGTSVKVSGQVSQFGPTLYIFRLAPFPCRPLYILCEGSL